MDSAERNRVAATIRKLRLVSQFEDAGMRLTFKGEDAGLLADTLERALKQSLPPSPPPPPQTMVGRLCKLFA